MRLLTTGFAGILLLANILVVSCDDDDDYHHHDDYSYVDDVNVDLTGTPGTDFEAWFEDDDHTQNLTGSLPFSADFYDQVGYFSAIVDKLSGGQETVCVRVESTYDEKESCTSAPFGRVSVSVRF